MIATTIVAPGVYDCAYFEMPIRRAVPWEGYAHIDLMPVTQADHRYTIKDITYDPRKSPSREAPAPLRWSA